MIIHNFSNPLPNLNPSLSDGHSATTIGFLAHTHHIGPKLMDYNENDNVVFYLCLPQCPPTHHTPKLGLSDSHSASTISFPAHTIHIGPEWMI